MLDKECDVTVRWRQSVIDYIQVEAQPADKFGHQPRLYALACQIGDGQPFDDDIVFAAAWMHDLGVFLGHRPKDPEELAGWDHVPYTIAQTRDLLAAWGFPPEKLDRVADAIRTHQPNDQPQTPEGVILRDADILEQLGSIGALRALVKVGRDTRYATYSSVMPTLRKAVDELPGKLRLDSAKRLAVGRVDTLRCLISAVEEEAAGALY
jgi:uncharacterized protein